MHDLVRLHAAEQAAAATREPALRRLVDFTTLTAFSGAMLVEPLRTPITPEPAVPDCHPIAFADDTAARAWFEAEHDVLGEVQRVAV
ncbi:hypothetical protein [Umezawaea sp. Da 62-37]|uniref:hypothetical protein n=1 Tax=Umezawaea sp. Da 62-37 TaxID=3075927 RepID=UPI0028F6F1FE|nr:hypothetical protein [Umezawaea sp. Da 62-37]WNV86048.1 hypothetical protein RM788_49380 [Umezawaea sp. Da 62-37]